MHAPRRKTRNLSSCTSLLIPGSAVPWRPRRGGVARLPLIATLPPALAASHMINLADRLAQTTRPLGPFRQRNWRWQEDSWDMYQEHLERTAERLCLFGEPEERDTMLDFKLAPAPSAAEARKMRREQRSEEGLERTVKGMVEAKDVRLARDYQIVNSDAVLRNPISATLGIAG
ncbi:MAG: hypothetical protein Q9214_006284 [Letrouitia sp. 1 TL-2023]